MRVLAHISPMKLKPRKNGFSWMQGNADYIHVALMW